MFRLIDIRVNMGLIKLSFLYIPIMVALVTDLATFLSL